MKIRVSAHESWIRVVCLTAFIFARSGSKGLPGKNIKNFAGKPLIAWAIEQALGVSQIERVIVSTDDDSIADIAKSFGADVPFMRPAKLASDTAPEWQAWRHALAELKGLEGEWPDPFISIPATSPLRQSSDIQACLDLYNQGSVDVVVAVTEAHRNPWFNMVKKDDGGNISLVSSTNDLVSRRQDAPAVFDMTTFAYIARPEYVMSQMNIFAGKVRAIEVPRERSIDIDTAHDFEVAEYLMNRSLEKS
jgi:CMP-N-acetylneuraminic acid synthetase